MASPEQPTPAEQHHRNSGLFSDHYLNVTLPRRADWRDLISEAEPALQKVSEIFVAYTPRVVCQA